MNVLEKLGLNEIREKYLSFFESKGHLRLPSFSLVPQNDNSLLLINAGMAPLKSYFTGKETPPSKRVTTCQKCIRTPDIERVGKTARHGTFFEMLGNFSFGDYFKNEATAWAWEFITKVLELPTDKLWVTIYEDDDEAFKIWTEKVGVPADRIVRMGKEDNFWEIGTGPCGPCSEIYFDRGEKYGCGSPDCGVGCDCDRYCEFWNLVFTQFDKDEDGNYNRLAHPNIDTGMGLERIAAIMQGVDNLFEVDTVRNIMRHVSKIANINYHDNEQSDVSLRVITDHIRGTVFMISDGIMPSNEGRGYVLRRLLRHAARHGKLIGINKPFLYEIVDTVVKENAGAYPELAEKVDFIKRVVKNEEENFDKTIDQGLIILNDYIDELKAEGKDTLDGEKAFKLYDTYGFPLDLTLEIAAEKNIKIDSDGFDKYMKEQQERSRAGRGDDEGAGWDENIYADLDFGATEFLGYDRSECEAHVAAISVDGKLCENAPAGSEAVIILDKTVCYGESGGEIGDKGRITGQGNGVITDVQKLKDGKFLHMVTVKEGMFEVGDRVVVAYDVPSREAIRRNHSATHLLQKALREVLGNHVSQSGSLVTDSHLRFDFTHFSAMTREELDEVENRVNAAIVKSLPVNIKVMPVEEAKKTGAMALFGEKYGDTVRVVNMGDYSIEFCGGCHVDNTAQIGLFKIVSESGVAAGTRRIEAVTGLEILKRLREAERNLNIVADTLKTTPAALLSKASAFVDELKNAKREISALKSKNAGEVVDDMIKSAIDIDGVKVIAAKLDDFDRDGLLELGDKIKAKVKNTVMVFATTQNDKINFVSMATKDAVENGVNAGKIIGEIAKIAGGGGGGRPDTAQAGGKIKEKVDEAISNVVSVVKKHIK